MELFTVLKASLVSASNENSWILIPASAFNLEKGFGWSLWRKSVLTHTYVCDWKRRVRTSHTPERVIFWPVWPQLCLLAKSLQSCPTLCDPIDGSPPGYPVRGILQARTLEWVAISFSNAWKWKVKVKSFSRVQLLATQWTIAHQAPPCMGFSRQEYWSGMPLPSPSHVQEVEFDMEPCFSRCGPGMGNTNITKMLEILIPGVLNQDLHFLRNFWWTSRTLSHKMH